MSERSAALHSLGTIYTFFNFSNILLERRKPCDFQAFTMRDRLMMPDSYLSTNDASLAVKYCQKLPRLQGLHKWGIKGFEKYLIFYLVTEELEQTLTFWFWGHIM